MWHRGPQGGPGAAGRLCPAPTWMALGDTLLSGVSQSPKDRGGMSPQAYVPVCGVSGDLWLDSGDSSTAVGTYSMPLSCALKNE